MRQNAKKKNVDKYQGMLSDTIISKCINDFFPEVKKWIVLPFININGMPLLITRRSETARKAVVLMDNDLVVIIKEFPWYCSTKEFVQFEINFQQSLSKEGIKIPRIYKNLSGEYFSTITQNGKQKHLFVQQFVKGYSWNHSEQQSISASRQLAELHNASERLVQNRKKHDSAFDLTLQMLNVASESLVQKAINVKTFKKYYSYANTRLNELKKEAISNGYNDEAIIIHGDYNPWNLLFSKEGYVESVLDFDNSTLDNPMRDVVEMILVFCFFEYKPNTTRFSEIPTIFNEKRAIKMLKEYFERSKFRQYELLPSLASCVSIELVSLAVARYDFYDYSKLDSVDKLVYEKFEKIVKELENCGLFV